MSVTITILLVSLGIFIFLAWYFSHKAKHLERLRLIEKGINPDTNKQDDIPLFWNKLAAIAIGLGFGLLIISILGLLAPGIINTGAMPIAILLLCSGTVLIISNKHKKS